MKRKALLATAGGIMTLLVGFLAIIEFFECEFLPDLRGEWLIDNLVESTTFQPYENMQLSFRIFVQQECKKITGQGEKWSVNGEEVIPQARSPIFLEGILEDGKLRATFKENGEQRATMGEFIWNVSSDGNSIEGKFTNTAADSRGTSNGTKVSGEPLGLAGSQR